MISNGTYTFILGNSWTTIHILVSNKIAAGRLVRWIFFKTKLKDMWNWVKANRELAIQPLAAPVLCPDLFINVSLCEEVRGVNDDGLTKGLRMCSFWRTVRHC